MQIGILIETKTGKPYLVKVPNTFECTCCGETNKYAEGYFEIQWEDPFGDEVEIETFCDKCYLQQQAQGVAHFDHTIEIFNEQDFINYGRF